MKSFHYLHFALLSVFICILLYACEDNTSSNDPSPVDTTDNPIDTTDDPVDTTDNPIDTSSHNELDTFSLKAWQGYIFNKRIKTDGGDSLKTLSDFWLDAYSIGGTLGVGLYSDSPTSAQYKLMYFETKPDISKISLSDVESWESFYLRPWETVGGYYIIQGKDGCFYQVHLDSLNKANYMLYYMFYFSWEKVTIQ